MQEAPPEDLRAGGAGQHDAEQRCEGRDWLVPAREPRTINATIEGWKDSVI